MATYTWEDILAYLYQSIPRTNAESFGVLLCDQIQNVFWDATDWRETIKEMAPFHPLPGEQDWGSPLVCVPSDFRGLRKCQVFHVSSDPPIPRNLTVLKDVGETWRMDTPESIAYDMAKQAFRLFPRFPRGYDPTDWTFQCTYKKQPTKITGATINSTIPFADHYFQTLVDVGQWLLAKADPRRVREVPALQAQAVSALREKASEEGLNLGESPLVPGSALDMFQWRW